MATSLTLTAALLNPIVARDPAAPRITWYDEASGGRIELSTVTLMNWAAKTGNLLRDEFGLAPGARVRFALPMHWQSASVALGAWWAGLDLVSSDHVGDVDLALVTGDAVDSEAADAPEVLAFSLDAFGTPVKGLPIGITDFATSVRAHGDQFTPGGVGPALDDASVDEVLTRATALVAEHGWTAADRLLATAPWASAADLTAQLVAPLAAGASLVQVAGELTDARREHLQTSERVTRAL